MPQGLILAAVLERDDPEEILGSQKQCHLLRIYPQARASGRTQVETYRAIKGNSPGYNLVKETCAAIFKHAANWMRVNARLWFWLRTGLLRLDLKDRITQFFEYGLEPARSWSGGVGRVQCRQDDIRFYRFSAKIDDANVRTQITAERAFLDRLGGGCSVPVGGLGRTKDGVLTLSGCVAAVDGSRILRSSLTAKLGANAIEQARRLGVDLAQEMLALGAKDILGSFAGVAPSSVSPP